MKTTPDTRKRPDTRATPADPATPGNVTTTTGPDTPPAGSETIKLEVWDNGVAVLTMDLPGETENLLRAEFAGEFDRAMDQLEHNPAIKGLVLISGKPDSFMAGADLSMIEKLTTAEYASSVSADGQRAFGRLGALPFPSVAAIHGTCLGGGLELALACTSRICTDSPRTELGLPEVMLGLMPAGGGTQRLPRLIGVAAALDLMLAGKRVKPRKALKLGIVDDVVRPSILLPTAVEQAIRLASVSQKVDGPLARLSGLFKELTTSEGLQELVLEENPIGRRLLFQQARKQLLSKTQGNYPAPEKVLEAVEIGLERGMEEGLKAESRLFGELVTTPQAHQLVQVFFATTALKKDNGVDDPKVKPRPLRKIGMVGAGLMGAGISYVTTAQAGLPVRLKDRDDEAVARGLKGVRELLEGRVKRRSLIRPEADLQFHRVTGTTDYSGFTDCDVVIEAVFEDIDLKHRVIQEVEAATGPDTIFASNTSSLPITRLAAAAKRPQNVIGMHYFSPVDKMPLLEVIVTPQTADQVTATCVALGKKQGKTVIVVRDGVGFYTSRILAPYMNEAARILSEGVPVEVIDRALRQWGFPVGPITLLDEVGIDVAEKVGHIMVEAFGERMMPPQVMQRLVDDGRQGRKNKRGFYTYNGKKKEVDPTVYGALGITPEHPMEADEIARRCTLLMINEALLCYGEGILRSARDGDIGAIFGLGFPPFRGGPFRFVDEQGAGQVLRSLEAFAQKYGRRFTPAPALVELAARSGKFYG